MRKWATRSRQLASSLALLALALALPSCGGNGGGGGGGGGGPTAGFATNDGAAAANLVRMVNAGGSGDTVDIEIRIGGATASTSYHGFAFDIRISDATVAQLVSGSATAGTFPVGPITFSAAQNAGSGCLDTSVPCVVVGVAKQGQSGDGVAAGMEPVVIKLTFRVLKVGQATLTFTGSPSNPNNPNCGTGTPEALDPNGNCIASAVFGQGGTISGS